MSALNFRPKFFALLFICMVFCHRTFSQCSFSGVVKSSPASNGLLADIKVTLTYQNTTAGMELKCQQQLVALKAIIYQGRTYSIAQLPAHIIAAYGKLPATTEYNFDLYQGATVLKQNIASKPAVAKIDWCELINKPADGLKEEECKAAGLKLFFSGTLTIKNVSVNVPFDDKAFKAFAPASTPIAPADKSSGAYRAQKPVSEIFSSINESESWLESLTGNVTVQINDVDAFMSDLEQLAKENRERRLAYESRLPAKAAGNRSTPTASLPISELEKAASSGDHLAIGWLARAYLKMDAYPKARMLYQHMAKKRDLHADRMIGLTYQYEKKLHEAIQFYEKAASQGDTESMKKLGAIYSGYPNLKMSDLPYPAIDSTNFSILNFTFQGVDFDKAVSWYEKAAAQGDLEAIILLFNLLGGADEKKFAATKHPETRFAYRKDLAKAQHWLQKAKLAAGGSFQSPATFSSQKMKVLGENLLSEGTISAGAKQYKEAFAKFQKAAALGNAKAIVQLGVSSLSGKGTSKNENEAFSYFQQAAIKGEPSAFYYLGYCYQNGVGVTKSLSKAFDLYSHGAKYGLAEAMGQLGFMYYQGSGVDRNLKRALHYFVEAKENGFHDADFYIGNVFRFGGYGIRRDELRAIVWYQKSINENDFGGLKFIGDVYCAENSAVRDHSKAIEYYISFIEQEKNEEVLTAHRDNVIKEIVKLYTTGGYGLDPDKKQAEEWLNRISVKE